MKTKRQYMNLGLMALAVAFIIILTAAVKLFNSDNAHQKYLNEHYPSVIRLTEVSPEQSDRYFILTPEERIVNVTVTHSDNLFRAVWCSNLQNMFMVEIYDACTFFSDPDFSSEICLQKSGEELRIWFIDESQAGNEEARENCVWYPHQDYSYGAWNMIYPIFDLPYDVRYEVPVPYRPITKEETDAFIKALGEPWEEFEVHPGVSAPVYE